MTDIQKRIDEIVELDKARTQGQIGIETFAIAEPKKGSLAVFTREPFTVIWRTPDIPINDARFLAKAPEMVKIINHLQAQLVERDRVIAELANLSGQLHALVTCTEYSESFRIFEANIIQQQIKAALTKTEEK